ncbi:MAG: PEP-CTERM sorting domain-containing protein [Desulfobacteraceae bacterium]|nr:PEP-CTERM sorting domain-containing protein [Desulfobacteraceae bacterium]
MKNPKHYINYILIPIIGVLLFSIAAWAVPIQNEDAQSLGYENEWLQEPADGEDGVYYGTYINNGDFLGVFSGNDNEENVATALDTYFGYEYYVTLASKTEFEEGGWGPDKDYDYEIIIENQDLNDDGEPYSGTWEVSPYNTAIDFYTVKAGNAFALYGLDPAESTGSWSTYHLWVESIGNEPLGISHFSAFNPTEKVPEPAAMLLLGVGMVGIAGWTRGRLKKKG